MSKSIMTRASRMLIILLLSLDLKALAALDDDSCFMDGNSTAALRHNQRCEAALADERNHISTFYMTSGASITALISGSLSAVSSVIILVLVRRSSIGLSSIYHRIICGMAIADALASAAAAFGIVPLPKDVIYDFDPGWVHGNQTTCAIQGFFIVTFISIRMMFSTMLSIYYVAAINFKKRDAEMKKCKMTTVFLPVIGIIFMVVGPSLALLAGSFNPSPFDPWCNLSAYPYYCQDKDEEVDNCLTGGNKISSVVIMWALSLVFVLLILNITTVGALISVVIGVYRQGRYIKEIVRLGTGRRLENIGKRKLVSTKKRQTYTKALSVQCAAYILSQLLCYLSMLAHIGESGDQRWGIQFYHTSFRPLQGIFDLLIFVGHKAYDNKVMNQSLTAKQAILQVFSDREEEKLLISNISLVRDDHAFYFIGEEREAAMYDVGGEDEDEVADDYNDSNNDNMNGEVPNESGVSFVDDPPSHAQSREDSRLSLISNYSELFGSWFSRGTESRPKSFDPSSMSVDSDAVSSTGVGEQKPNHKYYEARME